VLRLGVFGKGRLTISAALIALVSATAFIGSRQSPVLTLDHTIGPLCTVTQGSPVGGDTTLTDSTIPKLTSVSWADPVVTVKPKSTAQVTVKLSDDCSGAGDVVLQLRDATTARKWYVGANYASSTITSGAINDTWNADVPVGGPDPRSVSVVQVLVLTGFTSLVYDSTKPPSTVKDVIDRRPGVGDVKVGDYRSLTPATASTVDSRLTAASL
jgi:hypothetical protein